MPYVKGRGVTVQMAATYGSAKSVTAVTKANPGVATSTSHGMTNGTVGYFSGVSGMAQLEGQAVKIANVATNTFELAGLNTTGYADFTGSCSFTPVATWHTLAEATSYEIGVGESEKLDMTTLLDIVKKEESGLLAPQSVSINLLAVDVPTTAMAAVIAAAQAGAKHVFRILLPGGATRVWYGEPSIPGESVDRGAVGTGSISVTVSGFVLLS